MRVADELVLVDGARPFAPQSAPRLARYRDDQNRTFWPFDWSPDGKKIVGFTSPPNWDVVMLTLDSQTYTRIMPGIHPRFLPDGKHLVHVNGSGEIALYDLDKGEGKVILSAKPDELQTPAVAPDGKWLYFARSSQGNAVWGAEM
jgi:Tol biopolymer transport system component